MRSLLLAFAGLLSFWACGQRSLILEEKIDAPFRLAVDGYLQNSQPLRRLVLTGLPADSLRVYLISGTGGSAPVFRYLYLPEAGNYRYVVMRNFAGTLQLRYRGRAEALPQNFTQVAFSRDLPYAPPKGPDTVQVLASAASQNAAAFHTKPGPEKPQVKSAVPPKTKKNLAGKILPAQEVTQAQKVTKQKTDSAVENKRVVPAQKEIASSPSSQKSPSKTPPAQAQSRRISAPADQKAGRTPALSAQIKEDTLRADTMATQEAVQRPAADTLLSPVPAPATADSAQVAAFAQGLDKLAYEFEKLRAVRTYLQQFKPAPRAIPRILEAFRYDQTRLDLIDELLTQWPEWKKHLPQWLPYLDYEMSRRKVKNKWYEK